MSGQRIRTAYGKRRARDKFWHENAEKVRLLVICGGMVIAASLVAQLLLG